MKLPEKMCKISEKNEGLVCCVKIVNHRIAAKNCSGLLMILDFKAKEMVWVYRISAETSRQENSANI